MVDFMGMEISIMEEEQDMRVLIIQETLLDVIREAIADLLSIDHHQEVRGLQLQDLHQEIAHPEEVHLEVALLDVAQLKKVVKI